MKIGMISLGCPKNLVDSEVMLGLGEQAGHTVTADAADADVLIVNTCAFIDRAKQESIDTILEMAEVKKAAPGKRLVVTGCLAERYKDELQAQIPEIDAVLGTGEIPQIVDVLASTPSGVVGDSPPPAHFGGQSPSRPQSPAGRWRFIGIGISRWDRGRSCRRISMTRARRGISRRRGTTRT